MAWDPLYGSSGNIVMFGGFTCFGALSCMLSDTWKIDGGAWSNPSSTGPTARCCVGMAYDETDSYLLLFGGGTYDTHGNEKESPETWLWRNSGSWCKPGNGCP